MLSAAAKESAEMILCVCRHHRHIDTAKQCGRMKRGGVKRGITNAVYTNTLMLELGETLYFSKGSEKNMKITTFD